VEDSLDLFAVNGHVRASHGVPAAGGQRAEPGMGEARAGMEIGGGGNGGEHGIAGFFVGICDGRIGGGAGFDGGGAGLAGGGNIFGQGGDRSCDSLIHDAEMVEGHPNGPVAAAIFEAG